MKPVFRITFLITLLTIMISIMGISSKIAWDLTDQDFTNIVSVILQVQATMFAITFGFSIISIERTAEFYSSEVIYASIRDSKLAGVVSTYLISITLSTFSVLWGKQLPNQRIVVFLNIVFIPFGVLALIYYLQNVAKGVTSESLLKQLAKRVSVHGLVKCIEHEKAYVHNWLSDRFIYYPPVRGIIDIVIEAINSNNRLLAANGIEILVHLAERICGDDKQIDRELHTLNKVNEYLLKIAAKTGSSDLSWKIRLGTIKDVKPIFIVWYFSSIFFGLYDLVKDQDENDLALLCIEGIRVSLQNNIYVVGVWWWENIEVIISFAVKNNHPTHIQTIADFFYSFPALTYLTSEDFHFEEIQEHFNSYRIDHHILGYTERIVKTIIDGSIDPQPLTKILQFTLLTAMLSVLHEEAITGGIAADALSLFSESIIEIEKTSWPDKETIYPRNVASTCIRDFEQAGKFIAQQVYKSDFAKNDSWWESFTRDYLIDSCVRPLGNYLFAEEWGNLFPSLLSTARYMVEVEMLAGDKLQKHPNHDEYSSDSIVRMFKEWFEHCPNYPNRGKWRNNADLIVQTICQSAYTIRSHNKRAFLVYQHSLKEAFESTYIWQGMVKCLQ